MTISTQAPGAVRSLVQALGRSVQGSRPHKAGREPSADGWKVYLLHTVTGQVGPLIDPVSGSWEIPLNGIESMSAVVRKADLVGIERRWYTPWWGGLLFTFSRDGRESPVLAGPITAWPSETDTDLGLDAAGLRAIYANLTIGPDPLNVKDRSLGHIMWLLVEQAQHKPGGGLPIVDGTPDPDGRGHERTYEAWNLSNNGLDKRMKELSEVIDGPDVMFRPRWVGGDHRFIEWAVMHGTTTSPRIASTGPLQIFDTTAARSSVATVQVITNAKALVSRVWATGSGEGEGTLVSRAEDFTLLPEGFPFMEAVVSDTAATTDTADTSETDSGNSDD